MRILAIAADATTFLKSYLQSELSTVSDFVADWEYEEISKEFLALCPAVVNALTDHMDASRCPDLQQAIDWTIKSELHAWTSFQNLAKGIAPTAWGDDTTETEATEPSHATPGDASIEEQQTLHHLQVAAHLEAEMGDAIGKLQSQRHTQR